MTVGDATVIVTDAGGVIVVEQYELFDGGEYDEAVSLFDVWAAIRAVTS